MLKPKPDKNTADGSVRRAIGIFVAVSVVLTILLVTYSVFLLKLIPTWTNRADFGEMFGAVNTFFSGLAFAGVITTVFLQTRELALQRDELKLTRTELRRTAEAQEKSEQALQKQSQALALAAELSALTLIPALTLRFVPTKLSESYALASSGHGPFDEPEVPEPESEPELSLLNVGNTIAYNIDMLVIAVYSAEESDPQSFVETHLRQGWLTFSAPPNVAELVKRLKHNNDGFFGVYDRFCYAVVPQGRRVSMTMSFPKDFFGLHLLMQYRDVRGINYHQYYWFQHSSRSGSMYRLISLEPYSPLASPRIDFDDDKLITADGTPLPGHLTDYSSIWNASIPVGNFDASWVGVEDRGVWGTI